MNIFKSYDYANARQFFFKKLTPMLSAAIKASGYSVEKPLNDLLKTFTDFELFCYIWKDAYLRAYVFDKEDQRRELAKTWQYAKSIIDNPDLKQQYINNHDDFVKNEYNKQKLSISNIIK